MLVESEESELLFVTRSFADAAPLFNVLSELLQAARKVVANTAKTFQAEIKVSFQER